MISLAAENSRKESDADRSGADLVTRYLRRSRISALSWVFILCTLFTLPSLFLRGAHYEEGTTIAIARGLFEQGHWPDTYRYGERLSERPAAVSWILGLVGTLTGELPVWIARLPTALSLFVGAILIFSFVRRYASAAAALVGAACFVASPMMLQKLITAESDIVVSVILFAAFVVFWRNFTAGRSIGMWGVSTALVAVAALIKGPQPLGYYFLGIGAFLVLQREWREFFRLILTGIAAAIVVGAWYYAVYEPGDLSLWASQSRLVSRPITDLIVGGGRFAILLLINLSPGVLLFAPLVAKALDRSDINHDPVLALALYAGMCSVVLLVWPGANGRYAMPAVLAVSAGAGLAFDRFVRQRERLTNFSIVALCILIGYQVAVNWIAMPVFPDKFRQQAILGQQVAAVATASSPLLVSRRAVNYNYLAYVPFGIRVVPFGDIERADGEGWSLVTPDEFEQLRKAGRANKSVRHVKAEPTQLMHFVLVER